MTMQYPIPKEDRQSDIFVGDGGQVYGPFDFKIWSVDDVEVWTRPSGQPVFSWQPSVLALKAANLPFDLFTVTFPSGQPSTTEIVVRSARLDDRSAGVLNGGSINPDALEKEFSKGSTLYQELRRDIARALKSDFGQEALTFDPAIEDGDALVKQGNVVTKGATLTDIAEAAANAELARGYRDEAEEAADRAADSADYARNNWAIAARLVGTGVQTDYPLTVDPGSENNMFVSAGGVDQIPGGATPPFLLVYSGGAPYIRITLPSGVEGAVRVSNAIAVNTPSDGSVTPPKLAAQAVTTPALADGAATWAKLQNFAATLRLFGRKTAGGGVGEEISPTDLRDNFFPAGSVIDSVVASYATNADLTAQIPSDDTVPQITEGTQVLSATITPKSTTNKLRIRFSGWAAASAIAPINFAIFNGGANAIHAGSVAIGTNGYYAFLVGEVEYVPGATSAQTITVRVGPGGAVTVRMNGGPSARLFGGVAAARLVVEEVKA